jgi:repressor LexA
VCIIFVPVNKTEQRDLKGLAFIKKSVRIKGISPSLREIMRAVGYNSSRSAKLLIERLVESGLIGYENGKILLVREAADFGENTVAVPLVGSVACGAPLLAEQQMEAEIRISTEIARPGAKHFLLRAVGDSMDDAGINDGDLVLVRQQATAKPGDIIVALVDDEATIKFFHPQGQVVVLRPKSRNPKWKPIIVSANLRIQGVFVAVIPDVLTYPDEHP